MPRINAFSLLLSDREVLDSTEVSYLKKYVRVVLKSHKMTADEDIIALQENAAVFRMVRQMFIAFEHLHSATQA